MSFLNKKAQGGNYLAVVIFLLVFGFFNILGYTIWLQFVTAITSTGYNTGMVTTAIEGWTNGFRAFDYVIVLLMAVMIIGIGILSYQIKTKTAFFIVSFIIGIFWGFVSYFFNYVFIQLVSPGIFSTAIGVFPKTMLICTNLHWIMLIEFVVGSITLYGKKEEELTTYT
jgi:hypothetical protein